MLATRSEHFSAREVFPFDRLPLFAIEEGLLVSESCLRKTSIAASEYDWNHRSPCQQLKF
jgi:hypothetical protein